MMAGRISALLSIHSRLIRMLSLSITLGKWIRALLRLIMERGARKVSHLKFSLEHEPLRSKFPASDISDEEAKLTSPTLKVTLRGEEESKQR